MSHEPDPRYGVWWLYGGREVAVVGASHRTVVCCGWWHAMLLLCVVLWQCGNIERHNADIPPAVIADITRHHHRHQSHQAPPLFLITSSVIAGRLRGHRYHNLTTVWQFVDLSPTGCKLSLIVTVGSEQHRTQKLGENVFHLWKSDFKRQKSFGDFNATNFLSNISTDWS